MTLIKAICGKRAYDKKTAITVRNMALKRGRVLRVYHCPDCNAWHVTHKKSYSEDYEEQE